MWSRSQGTSISSVRTILRRPWPSPVYFSSVRTILRRLQPDPCQSSAQCAILRWPTQTLPSQRRSLDTPTDTSEEPEFLVGSAGSATYLGEAEAVRLRYFQRSLAATKSSVRAPV